MSKISDSPLLMQARTGGLSLFALVLLLAAIGCLIVQVSLLIGGQLETMEPAARFLPGALALVFLIMFWLKGMRRGELAVHTAGLVGRTKSGKRYTHAWDAVHDIDMRGRMLILQNDQGKSLLVDSPPNEKYIRGLIWLLIHHDFSQEVWQQFAAEPTLDATTATRQFLDEAGSPVFMDLGFVLDLAGQATFFPESDTVVVPKKIANEQNLSTTLTPSGMLLKFDPNPAELPIRRLCAALLASPMEEKLRRAGLLALQEQHGGAPLESASDGWTGETSGWKIQVLLVTHA